MFPSARIARSRDISLLLTKAKALVVLNAMVYTRLNITVILHGAIKQTSRLISYILKPNKVNCALTLSNT